MQKVYNKGVRKTHTERRKTMKYVIDQNGNNIDYEAAVNLMDNEIREELHREMAPCTEQEFYDAYCKRHEETYHEEFVVM